MKHLKIALSTWDIAFKYKNHSDFATNYLSHIRGLLNYSKVVVLPEYAPCAHLPASAKGQEEHHNFIWKQLAHDLKKLSKEYDALILAGTAPYRDKKKNSNRALLFASGKEYKSSKVALTPWENEFKAGKKVLTFKWKKLHFAVLICLDVEMPEISSYLKQKGVDIVLVPSATTDVLGSERVQRCASARAIELGALVAVTPLLGKSPEHPLVDVNIGRLEFHLPSQEAIQELMTPHLNQILENGIHVKTFVYERRVFKGIKKNVGNQETKPFLLKVKI